MKPKIERGTYSEVVTMHGWAIANGWICGMSHDSKGYFLKLWGKIKYAKADEL